MFKRYQITDQRHHHPWKTGSVKWNKNVNKHPWKKGSNEDDCLVTTTSKIATKTSNTPFRFSCSYFTDVFQWGIRIILRRFQGQPSDDAYFQLQRGRRLQRRMSRCGVLRRRPTSSIVATEAAAVEAVASTTSLSSVTSSTTCWPHMLQQVALRRSTSSCRRRRMYNQQQHQPSHQQPLPQCPLQ